MKSLIISILIVFIIYYITYKLVNFLLRNNTKYLFDKIHKDHLKPNYYGYCGGFSDVNKCVKCELTGLYEDLHQANSCPRCGGKILSNGSKKYINKEGVYMWFNPE